MAVDKFLQTVWSARITQAVFRQSVYAQISNRNWEADAANAAKVNIQEVGAINVGDYRDGTDLVIQDLSDSQKTLTLDQRKYFAFRADDVERVQSSPGLIDGALRNGAGKIAETQDDYLKDLFDNQATAAKIHEEGVITGVMDGYLGAISSIKQVIRADGFVLEDGDIDIVITPQMAKVMELYLSQQGHDFGGQIAEKGLMTRVLGCNIWVTTAVNVADNTDAKEGYECPVVVRRGAVTFAEQIAKIEAQRMEKQFADLVKGLYVYAGLVVQPNHLYKINARFEA